MCFTKSTNSKKFERQAYHESGHAIIGTSLGYILKVITVKDAWGFPSTVFDFAQDDYFVSRARMQKPNNLIGFSFKDVWTSASNYCDELVGAFYTEHLYRGGNTGNFSIPRQTRPYSDSQRIIFIQEILEWLIYERKLQSSYSVKTFLPNSIRRVTTFYSIPKNWELVQKLSDEILNHSILTLDESDFKKFRTAEGF